jgi:cyclopropane fatty-acyl-phospholipid synthase-like methyltransferase
MVLANIYLSPKLLLSLSTDVEETANKLFSRGNDFNQLELESLLHEAQIRKYDAILDSLNNQQKPLNCHDHVLEIGFGWGAFAIHAVKRHCCKWTGLTLSSVGDCSLEAFKNVTHWLIHYCVLYVGTT